MRILKWFFMLSKRLYKKPSFIALLLLIPACVSAFSFAAGQKSGFVNIVLAKTDADDSISSQIVTELLTEGSIINFTMADTPESAIEKVKNGLADEAWIFPANTASQLDQFIKNSKNYVVSVVTKEQTASLKLAREKLSAQIYKYCAKSYYIDYVRTHIPELEGMSDDRLCVYFDEVPVDENLFVMGNPADVSGTQPEPNYLTSPIRGLLGILAVICGMAATMFFMQDCAFGTFSFVKQSRMNWLLLGCVAAAVVNVSAVLFVSLCVSSLSANIAKELLILVLYTVCVSAFCLFLSKLFKTINSFAAIIPLMSVVLIAVCPVFFDFRSIIWVQRLFPPTYFVNAMYDDRYLIYMVIYSLVLIASSLVLSLFSKSRRRI